MKRFEQIVKWGWLGLVPLTLTYLIDDFWMYVIVVVGSTIVMALPIAGILGLVVLYITYIDPKTDGYPWIKFTSGLLVLAGIISLIGLTVFTIIYTGTYAGLVIDTHSFNHTYEEVRQLIMLSRQ